MAIQVDKLFREAAFDPEEVKILCAAYDMARRSLHDTGQPDLVTEIIAGKIISLARAGERDPAKLCEGALVALGNKVFGR